jgi:hypothetical protein
MPNPFGLDLAPKHFAQREELPRGCRMMPPVPTPIFQ